MKVGLFGGSFNPIHNSHIRTAKMALESKFIDEVWLIPCGEHAFGKKLESPEHRIKMIEYAIEGTDDIKINDIELRYTGINYTADTVKKLKEKYNHDYSFIIGSDILQDLPNWERGEELARLVKFLVFERNGYPIQKVFGDMTICGESFFGVSSTKIRENVARGDSISGMVPKKVEDYIIRERLYGGV